MRRSAARIGLAAMLAFFAAASLPAAVLVSDFSSFSSQLLPPMGITWSNAGIDQYIQDSGFISIAPVNGGAPKGDGYFNAMLPGSASLNFTGLNTLSLTARVDAGNASSILHVLFYDNTFTQVASNTFNATDFTSTFSTKDVTLSLSGIGDPTAVTYWQINGDGIASDAFRYSFDNLSVSAIPEPRIIGLLLAGLIFLGRKRFHRVRACNPPVT